MRLQDQCCTRKQGQRLVELGLKAESYFSHFKAFYHAGICWSEISVRHIAILSGQLYDTEDIELVPAFNVAELGALLPDQPLCNRSYSWYHRNNWRGHSVGYSEIGGHNHIEVGWYETEAQARADLLIHLLENNLIQLSTGLPTRLQLLPERSQVTVDLNQARINLGKQYNDVISCLIMNTESDGYIRLDSTEIADKIENLRSSVSTICHTYIEGNDLYDNISKQVGVIKDFNPNNY